MDERLLTQWRLLGLSVAASTAALADTDGYMRIEAARPPDTGLIRCLIATNAFLQSGGCFSAA